MKTLCVIQARMSSTRLPGKVMFEVAGHPYIMHMIARVRRARSVDRIVVATSREPSDDVLAEALTKAGVEVFRGDLNDVLSRYCAVAKEYPDADVIVRLTADCPLIDPEVIDQVVTLLMQSGADYASNIEPPTFPDGLDVEAMTRETLERLCSAHDLTPEEREHVTLYVRRRPEAFRIANLRCQQGDLSHDRWTLDYPEDHEKISRALSALLKEKPDFLMRDVLDFLRRHREIDGLNAHRALPRAPTDENDAS